MAQHRGQIGFCCQQEVLLHRTDSLSATAHLPLRFFARDVEDPLPGRRGLAGNIEQQSGLADAGFSGQQNNLAGNKAAAEHTIELIYLRGARTCRGGVDFSHGLSGCQRCGLSRFRLGRGSQLDSLFQSSPFPALGAAAQPFGAPVAAVRAFVSHMHSVP